jgi:anti-sigma factor RsiW
MKRACAEVEPLLAAYVDGEASAGERATIDTHLARCEPCRHHEAHERTMRGVLRARRHELGACASPQLRTRCAAAFAPAAAARVPHATRTFAPRTFARRTWIPLSFAATLLLAVSAVFIIGLNGSVEALATQLAMDHVKCFQLSPVHGTVDASAAGQAWYQHYGWLLRIPRSQPTEQLELVDVRRCLSTEGITAHLMYRWRGTPLSVYVLNSVPKSDAPIETRLSSRERQLSTIGQQEIIWSAGGRTYAVVGKGQRSDLERVAQYVRTAAASETRYPSQ